MYNMQTRGIVIHNSSRFVFLTNQPYSVSRSTINEHCSFLTSKKVLKTQQVNTFYVIFKFPANVSQYTSGKLNLGLSSGNVTGKTGFIKRCA